MDEQTRRVRGIGLLVGQLRAALRLRHYSRHTEKAYVAWLRRFATTCDRRHPIDVERGALVAFLSSLSSDRVSASTQNQAASALAFLLGEILGRPPGELAAFVRPRLPRRAPAVLSRGEVDALLAHVREPWRLLIAILYGAGLRLSECCRLQIRDVDFGAGEIAVREGKGGKDRRTLLPQSLVPELRAHVERLRRSGSALCANAAIASRPSRTSSPHAPFTSLPKTRLPTRSSHPPSAELPSPASPPEVAEDSSPLLGWLFPGRRLHVDVATGFVRRSHVHPNVVQREIAIAARAAGLGKHVTCHTLRHSFATELLSQRGRTSGRSRNSSGIGTSRRP